MGDDHQLKETKPGEGNTIVPPVPVPDSPNDQEHHEVMGQILARTIERGKSEVPHAPAPLVCKPRELESWRVFKIMSEFVEGFETIKKYGLAASVFGTARASFEQHFYQEATELSGRLAKAGFAIITGGGSGIMEAANKGAYEAGGASIGLNIRLEESQGLNTYLTDSYTFEHFFVRKVMLAYAAEVYIFFPGGYGTMDEFFEMVTLIQTKKIRKVPVIIYGKEYWEPLLTYMHKKFLEEHASIDQADLDMLFLADSVDEAYEYITKNVQC